MAGQLLFYLASFTVLPLLLIHQQIDLPFRQFVAAPRQGLERGPIELLEERPPADAGDLHRAIVDGVHAFANGGVQIRQGIERLRRRDPVQAAVYEGWLGTLHRDYADRIVPITSDIAEEWGRLNIPGTIPVIDGLLAATAIVMGLTLATRNTADVARTWPYVLNVARALRA